MCLVRNRNVYVSANSLKMTKQSRVVNKLKRKLPLNIPPKN